MISGENTILKYLENMKRNSESEIVEKMITYLDVFTDGSEIKEKGTYKTLGLGWAFVVKENKETTYSTNGSVCEGNNQRVELLAIYKALQYILEHKNRLGTKFDITIHSDSDYSIKSLTLWSLNWVRNDWMTSSKTQVKHRDIIEPCLQMIKDLKTQHSIVFNHVRSHTNKKDFVHLGNAEADALATGASKASLCSK